VASHASQQLLDLIGRRPSTLELDRAALELAGIEYPALNPLASLRELDRIAFAIADRAADLSDGECFVETANRYLFGELGFRGDTTDYYRADNSCLNKVLENRTGIPLTLSVVYMEVARRLAKPVSGIGLPGHFVVRYEDEKYSVFIDPYHGGKLLDESGCAQLAQTDNLTPDLLAAVDRRYVVMRMINNLRQVYFSRRQAAKAVQLLDLLISADPNCAEEYKQRAVAMLIQHRTSESLAGFRKYLELMPEAPDRARIEEQIRNLVHWQAARN
jgi:regulator of sirC expression with transglutaminase-like and TPR domain